MQAQKRTITHPHASVYNAHENVHSNTRMYMHTHIHSFTHTYSHTHTHTRIDIYLCTHARARGYI